MRRLSMLVALTLLSACGQSGDLYLPEPEPAPPEAAAPAAPAADEDKKKD
jgi:predicted small lipoprotein YifL